jgi:hypothetical protein
LYLGLRVQQNAITPQQVATLSKETDQSVKAAGETRRATELLQKTNDMAATTNDIV